MCKNLVPVSEPGLETGREPAVCFTFLFVSEGFELPEPQGPIQLTLEDSTLKSVSTQACQAGSDKTSLPLCAHNLKWF